MTTDLIHTFYVFKTKQIYTFFYTNFNDNEVNVCHRKITTKEETSLKTRFIEMDKPLE